MFIFKPVNTASYITLRVPTSQPSPLDVDNLDFTSYTNIKPLFWDSVRNLFALCLIRYEKKDREVTVA